jgi:hypothetical protein
MVQTKEVWTAALTGDSMPPMKREFDLRKSRTHVECSRCGLL